MSRKPSSDPVLYRKDDDIAVITINNPPVNTLSKHVRKAIACFLEVAANDSAVGAIVIGGNGR
ncbi:MAG: hypothetical protein CL573_02650, partial [Alphaproteobacteria bacterium]|nr:hypothetical protein [Alphaproteobacteria bacterium]